MGKIKWVTSLFLSGKKCGVPGLKAGRQRRGFTLVEALVAGMILALAGGVLSLTVRQGLRSLTAAMDYQQAAELLDRTLTKIDAIGPARLLAEGPAAGTFAAPHDRFAWKTTVDTTQSVTPKMPSDGK